MRKVVLPGSVGEEAEGRAGGRWSAEDAAALAQVARWWRGRLARGDAADPLTSGFGGVDDNGTARTVGLAAAEVALARPISTLAVGRGVALWLHALGVPDDPAAAGEVYSVVGLGHVYRDAAAGWRTRYATLGRAPANATTLELRIVVDLGTGLPAVQVVGVAGVGINWKVEAYRLER